jgi:hypothetical protein
MLCNQLFTNHANYQRAIKVAGEKANFVRDEIRHQYRCLKRKFAEHKGYLAEVYMIQMLWNSQRQVLPGKYFHSSKDIQVPNRFTYIVILFDL